MTGADSNLSAARRWICRRWIWAELGSGEVWLLVGAVITPLLFGAVGIVKSREMPFDEGGALALFIITAIVVVADSCLVVYYSARRGGGRFGRLGIPLTLGLVLGGLLVWGSWWTLQDWQKGEGPSVAGLLLIGAAGLGFVITMASPAPPARTELLRGALAVFTSGLAVVGLIVALSVSWPDSPWVRFIGVTITVLIAVWAIGSEWSRPWVIGSSLAGLLGVAAVLIAVGYDDLNQAPLERITTASLAVGKLQEVGAERTEQLAENRDSALERLALRQTVAARRNPTGPADQQRTDALSALVARLEAERDVASADPEATEIVETAAKDPALDALLEDLTQTATAEAPDGWWATTVDDAAAAVEAQQALAEYEPVPSEAWAAIEVASTCAKKADTEPEACPSSKESGTPGVDAVERVTLADRLYEMDVAVAEYRADVTGEAEDAEAAAALKVAGITTPDPVTFRDAIEQGPAAVSTALFGNRAQPLVPGVVGWAVFGAIAIAAWSLVLRANSRQLAGPVEIQPVGRPSGQGDGGGSNGGSGDSGGGGAAAAATTASEAGPTTQADTVLRIAVLQNLPEPGSVPGSEALETVTNLTSIPGFSSTWVSSVVKAVGDLVGKPYGYAVVVEVLKVGGGTETDPTLFKALARVKDRRSKATLATQAIVKPTEDEAVRSAGLWASGYILARSTRVPSWATWNADTAPALGKANEARPTLAELEEAVRVAPNSGLLLYNIASLCELDGRFYDALDATCRAVAGHPRYFLARYRLAATLAMMGAHRPNIFAYKDAAVRATTVGLLKLAVEAQELRGGRRESALEAVDRLKVPGLTPGSARDNLLVLAGAFLLDLEHRSRCLPIVAGSLRRSERDLLLQLASPFASGRRKRRRRIDMAWSARLIHENGTDREVKRLRDRARRPASAWQLTYNAACAAATDFDDGGVLTPDIPLTLLESCLVKPDVHQLDATWLERDPDLVPLHGQPRFQRLLHQFPGEEQ